MLLVVGLFNEGVDVPEIGLTVLDFIGNANQKFRFDQRYRALTETTRAGVIKQIEDGFPYLPAGCKIQLDRVAQGLILENLKQSIGGRFDSFVRELRALGRDVGLAEFLSETGVALEGLYRNSGWTWTRLRREAGLPTPVGGPWEDQLLKGPSRLIHMDDASRLAFLSRTMAPDAPPAAATLSEAERRMLLALHFTLWGAKDEWASLDASLAELWAHPAVLSELRELFDVLEEQSGHLTYPVSGNPHGLRRNDPGAAPQEHRPLLRHAREDREGILAMPADFFREAKVAAG